MKEKINVETWERKRQYNFFSKFDNPYACVTTILKVDILVEYSKKNKISFYALLTYFTIKTLNKLDEFKYVLENNDVYKYDNIKVSFSVLTQNNQINFSRVLELSSFQMFVKEFMTAKLEAESEKNDTYEKVNNICYVTCAPWMRMTSVQHPMNYKIKDSIPRVCWGKYFVKNNKFLIDYSIQVNHGFQDGYHIARFFHELQREIENFGGELNDSMY